MIPVCDAIPAPTRPLVTVILIAVLVIAFLALPPAGTAGIGSTSVAQAWLPAALNGLLGTVRAVDWLTLVAAIAALWLFGPTVEDRLGRGRFALLYFGAGLLSAGLVAAAGHAMWVHLGGPAAAVGGVIAARLSLYPKGRTVLVVPDISGIDFVDVSSALLAGFWFLAQMLSAGAHLRTTGRWTLAMAVAHLAVGAIIGGAAVHALKRRERMAPDWWSRLR